MLTCRASFYHFRIFSWRNATRASRLRTSAGEGIDARRLDRAATNFAKGVKSGINEDDAVAFQLGVQDATELSKTQDQYKDKLKQKLADRAEQIRQEQEERSRTFKQGQDAYATGQYAASVVLLETALKDEGPMSQLGGEIQLWLALAYQACGREKDCIQVYKSVERNHPSPKMQKQAESLRFIMEAPKLELSDDERIQFSGIADNLEPYNKKNKGKRRWTQPTEVVKRPPPERTLEEIAWDKTAQRINKNKYVWAGAALTLVVLAYASFYWKVF